MESPEAGRLSRRRVVVGWVVAAVVPGWVSTLDPLPDVQAASSAPRPSTAVSTVHRPVAVLTPAIASIHLSLAGTRTVWRRASGRPRSGVCQ